MTSDGVIHDKEGAVDDLRIAGLEDAGFLLPPAGDGHDPVRARTGLGCLCVVASYSDHFLIPKFSTRYVFITERGLNKSLAARKN